MRQKRRRMVGEGVRLRWRVWLRSTGAVGLPAVALVLLLAVTALLPLVPLQALQLYAADLLFLWEGGPGLGHQPVDPNIVLVLQDAKTYNEIGSDGWPPTTDEDIAVYRTLLDDGARAIGDTRPVFLDQPETKRLLDQILALDPGDRVVREIAFSEGPDWFVNSRNRYLPHVGADPIFYVAGYDVVQRVRYYPLLTYSPAEGFDETLALKVARVALGLPPPTDVPGVARATGIAAAWVAATGLAVSNLPASLQQVPERAIPYPFGAGRSLPWVIAPRAETPLLSSPAALWINYPTPLGGYRTFSYVDVLTSKVPPAALRGKIVVIGAPAIVADTYPVPTAPTARASTDEIVAAAVQTVVDRRFLQPEPLLEHLLTIVALGVSGSVIARKSRPSVVALLLVVTLGVYLAYSTWLYRQGIFPDLIVPPVALITSSVVQGGARFVREERARRQVTDLFGRYVPRSVVSVLVQQPERALALGGEKREVTVLFADIRGFTAFAEPLPPEQVLSALNALLQAVVACIFQHQGTIDKYIGDAVMVLFNAPLDQPDHPVRAVRAALAMQEAVAAAGGGLALGIGIHTGEAVVGNVGTPERLEYTAIGRTVNLAARLCETAAKGEVILSAETYARVGGTITAEPRPPLRVKGIDRDLITYRVLAGQG